MIIVCELQCRGISHESVNSGFIYGLRKTYPKDKIIFFADLKYFQNIKQMLKNGGVNVNNLSNQKVTFNSDISYSIRGILSYYVLCKKMFDKALSVRTNKVFFLSINPVILFAIKKLKQKAKYKDICCTFVLHGGLEDIANTDFKEAYVPGIKWIIASFGFKKSLVRGLKNPDLVLRFSLDYLLKPIRWLNSEYSLIFKRVFRLKKMMLWGHTNQYKYISLSPHVTINAGKYIDTNYLNFQTIFMPIIFAKPIATPNNQFIKFAVFGYGDSAQMYKMLSLLSKKRIDKPYEIRIISMDDRGTDGFENITNVGNGSVLTRKEMENSARDIDIFINLYDKSRHRFGCSLSIFEAFSYLKPVLHLSNPGYNYFNKPGKPIGYRCESLDDFVNKMCDMINNFPLYKKQLAIFRKNMLEYRKEYAIENNLDNLKESFTF
jgi:hypothetical protein